MKKLPFALLLFLACDMNASQWTISTVAGTGVRGFSGDVGPATDASLSSPHSIPAPVNPDRRQTARQLRALRCAVPAPSTMPPWQFAFHFNAVAPFPEYVKSLEAQARGIGVPAHFVPHSYLVGVVDGVSVGRLSLRHTLKGSLNRVGGHIGYGVIPSQRFTGRHPELTSIYSTTPWDS